MVAPPFACWVTSSFRLVVCRIEHFQTLKAKEARLRKVSRFHSIIDSATARTAITYSRIILYIPFLTVNTMKYPLSSYHSVHPCELNGIHYFTLMNSMKYITGYLMLLFDVDNDCEVMTSQSALLERRTTLRRICVIIRHMFQRICDVIRHML